jgi:hypothetical protein
MSIHHDTLRRKTAQKKQSVNCLFEAPKKLYSLILKSKEEWQDKILAPVYK